MAFQVVYSPATHTYSIEDLSRIVSPGQSETSALVVLQRQGKVLVGAPQLDFDKARQHKEAIASNFHLFSLGYELTAPQSNKLLTLRDLYTEVTRAVHEVSKVDSSAESDVALRDAFGQASLPDDAAEMDQPRKDSFRDSVLQLRGDEKVSLRGLQSSDPLRGALQKGELDVDSFVKETYRRHVAAHLGGRLGSKTNEPLTEAVLQNIDDVFTEMPRDAARESSAAYADRISGVIRDRVGDVIRTTGLDFAPEGTRAMIGQLPDPTTFTIPTAEPSQFAAKHSDHFLENDDLLGSLDTQRGPYQGQKQFPDTPRQSVAIGSRAMPGDSTARKGIRATYEYGPEANEISRLASHVRGIHSALKMPSGADRTRSIYEASDAAGYVAEQQMSDQRAIYEETSKRTIGTSVSLLGSIDQRSGKNESSLLGIRSTSDLDRMEAGFTRSLRATAEGFAQRQGRLAGEAMEVVVLTDDVRDVMLGQAAMRLRDAGGVRVRDSNGREVLIPIVVTTVGGAGAARSRISAQMERAHQKDQERGLHMSTDDRRAIADEISERSNTLLSRSNIHHQVSAAGLTKGNSRAGVHQAQAIAHRAAVRQYAEAHNHTALVLDDDVGHQRKERLDSMLQPKVNAGSPQAYVEEGPGKKGLTRTGYQLVGSMSQLFEEGRLEANVSSNYASRGAQQAAQARGRLSKGMRTGRVRAGTAGKGEVRVTARQSHASVASLPHSIGTRGERVSRYKLAQSADESLILAAQAEPKQSQARRLGTSPGAMPDASGLDPQRNARRRASVDTNEATVQAQGMSLDSTKIRMPKGSTLPSLVNLSSQLDPHTPRETAAITGPDITTPTRTYSMNKKDLNQVKGDISEELGTGVNNTKTKRRPTRWGTLQHSVSARVLERVTYANRKSQRDALDDHLAKAADEGGQLDALPVVVSRRDALRLASAAQAKGLGVRVAEYQVGKFGHMPNQERYVGDLHADNAAYAARRTENGLEYVALARMPLKEREALHAATGMGKTVVHEVNPLQISLASVVYRRNKDKGMEFRLRNEVVENNHKMLVGIDKGKIDEDGFYQLSKWTRNKAEDILRKRIAGDDNLRSLDQHGYARTKLAESLVGKNRVGSRPQFMKTSQSSVAREKLAGAINDSLNEAVAFEQSLQKGKNFRDFSTLAKGLIDPAGRTDAAFEVSERVRGLGDAKRDPSSIYSQLHDRMRSAGHTSSHHAALHLAEMEQAGIFEMRDDFDEGTPSVSRPTKGGVRVADAKFSARTAATARARSFHNSALSQARGRGQRNSMFNGMARRFKGKNFAFAPLAMAGMLNNEQEGSQGSSEGFGSLFDNITALDVVGVVGMAGLAHGAISSIRRGRAEASRETGWKAREGVRREEIGKERDRARAFYEFGQQLFDHHQKGGESPQSVDALTQKHYERRMAKQAQRGRSNYNSYSTLERMGVNFTANPFGGALTSNAGRIGGTVGLQMALFDSYAVEGMNMKSLQTNTATYLLNQVAATGFTPGYYQKMDQSAQAQRDASIRTTAGFIGLAAGAAAASIVQYGSPMAARMLHRTGQFLGNDAMKTDAFAADVPHQSLGNNRLNNAGQGAAGRAGRGAQNAAVQAASSTFHLPQAMGQKVTNIADGVAGGVSRSVGAGAANVAGAGAFVGVALATTAIAITLLDSYGFQKLKSEARGRGGALDQVDLDKAVGTEDKYGKEGDVALEDANEIEFEDAEGNPLEVSFEDDTQFINLVAGMDGSELSIDESLV